MRKVLIIGPFPNPMSGVSLANKVVKKLIHFHFIFFEFIF